MEREQINAGIRARYADAVKTLKRKEGVAFGKPYHSYYLGKDKLPGVTTVIGVLDKSRPLMAWAVRLQVEADVQAAYDAYRHATFRDGLSLDEFRAIFQAFAAEKKAHVEELEKAGNIGTDLHALVEARTRTLMGEPTPLPKVRDEALWLFDGWERWAKEARYEPVLCEAPVFSFRKRYAGTVDVLAWVYDRLAVVDWKTSGDFHAEMDLQSVAYRDALSEMGVALAPAGVLVRIPKAEDDPRPFEVREVADEGTPQHAELRRVFESCLTIQPWKKAEDDLGLAKWKAKRDAAKRQQ